MKQKKLLFCRPVGASSAYGIRKIIETTAVFGFIV